MTGANVTEEPREESEGEMKPRIKPETPSSPEQIKHEHTSTRETQTGLNHAAELRERIHALQEEYSRLMRRPQVDTGGILEEDSRDSRSETAASSLNKASEVSGSPKGLFPRTIVSSLFKSKKGVTTLYCSSRFPLGKILSGLRTVKTVDRQVE